MTICRFLSLVLALQSIAFAANPPRVIALMDESPIVVRLPNRTLGAWLVKASGEHDQVFEILSTDNGRAWTPPRSVHVFSEKAGTFGGPEPLVDQNGEIHLFLVRVSKYTMGNRGEAERPSFDDYKGNRIDIWHMKSNPARTVWTKPKEIWAGYTGALNSVLQMRSGRILLPFSYFVKRNWRDRGKGFAEFTFLGQFNSTLVYSDDHGETFHLSPTPLSIEVPDIVSAYGAVEPVAIELKDGRVWNLIRGQTGRFYESFSTDGAHWTEPQPNAILNSDSPAGLARTDDGKLVLVWNNCLRYPYAYGGRQVLHAAISEDEGKTWTGYREVLKDPKRHEPPPTGGDFGTAYPFPTTVFDGEVIIRSGQGKGRNALVALDPKWLYETTHRSDFATDLEDWTYFGSKGVARIPHPDKPGRHVMQIAKSSAAWPAGAVWNFPNGLSGTLTLKFQLRSGFRGANLALADHYSVPWDKEDHFYSLWNLPIDSQSRLLGSEPVALDRWHTLEVTWSVPSRTGRVSLDGKRIATLPLRRETTGANYFRIRSTTVEPDPGGMLVESAEVTVAKR
ncbi:MAG: exo-alpha-sialidase [Bryobacteraceae bacterium]